MCITLLHKPPGVKYELHQLDYVETDPICASFPEDMQRLMMIFSELPETDQKRLVKLAEVFVNEK